MFCAGCASLCVLSRGEETRGGAPIPAGVASTEDLAELRAEIAALTRAFKELQDGGTAQPQVVAATGGAPPPTPSLSGRIKRQVDLLREQTRQLTAAETSPQRAGQTGDGPRSTNPAAELTPSFSPTFRTMRTVDRPARVVVVAGAGPRATPTASTTRPSPSLKTSSLLLKCPCVSGAPTLSPSPSRRPT